MTEREPGCEALAAMRAVAEAIDPARVVEQDVASGALSKNDASPVTIADFQRTGSHGSDPEDPDSGCLR
jgi:hypothetical protein